MSIEPDAVEMRILGCLVEKQRTTPDQYPLSVNAIRNACNQSTNRDPVVDYDERTVLDGLERLSRRRWVRLTSGAGSRARKYRHLVDTELSLAPDEIALAAVLMLRGPQTPGELKTRTERLHPFDDLEAIDETLEGLIARELAQRLERRPGQKEVRYRHLLSDEEEDAAPAAPAAAPAIAPPAAAPEPDRLERVERELTSCATRSRACGRSCARPGTRRLRPLPPRRPRASRAARSSARPCAAGRA